MKASYAISLLKCTYV